MGAKNRSACKGMLGFKNLAEGAHPMTIQSLSKLRFSLQSLIGTQAGTQAACNRGPGMM